MRDYNDLFAARGSAYDRAMRQYPSARNEEFRQAVTRATLRAGMVVADVPAGGGYLRHHLPENCIYQSHEPCASFHASGGSSSALQTALLPLPWPDNSIDVALSIAGLHHMKDKRTLFADMHRVVRPGGRLVISDVAEGSKVADFLDGYVGDNNSTGHEGAFLSQRTLADLRGSGWRVLSSERVRFHWVFDDQQSMGRFCHQLFDLCRTSEQDTIDAVENYLGTDRIADSRIGMRWELMTVVAEREA